MVRAFLARGNNTCKDRKIEEIGITEYQLIFCRKSKDVCVRDRAQMINCKDKLEPDYEAFITEWEKHALFSLNQDFLT